jgi:cytochrome c peroxidase
LKNPYIFIRGGTIKRVIIVAIGFLFIANLTGWLARPALSKSQRKREKSSVVRLGERLFRDDRFSTPNGDLPASCSHCHLLDEDPQGLRAYTDFFNRSWISSRSQDHRRLELRNSPTIFDVAEMPRLHFDGEFGSLEDLVKGTLSGRPMGWLPGEEIQAFERIRAVLLTDKGEGKGAAGAYREQFNRAFGLNVERLNRDETVDLVAKAVADFMRTLKTRRDAPYDKFIALNGLATRPAPGESNEAFAQRTLARIDTLATKGALNLTRGFGLEALRGFKIFFRTQGDGSAGNCVTCHAPPLFTDFSFHNLGVSQSEYDQVHGEGKFAGLSIPSATEGDRPSARFRERPAKNRPGEVDLGFWNFVDLKNSPLRRPGESDDRLLQRMVATFKTPTLRNLAYSQPYFHNGSAPTLAEVMNEIMRLSEMSRAGRLRECDEELAEVKIAAADILPLIAFMNSLNEDLKLGY